MQKIEMNLKLKFKFFINIITYKKKLGEGAYGTV